MSDLLSKSSFVHQLNAKLAAQQHDSGSGGGGVQLKQQQQRPLHHPQQEMSSLSSSRESLMDQIRRGTALRRARSTSDRSSPHFKNHH